MIMMKEAEVFRFFFAFVALALDLHRIECLDNGLSLTPPSESRHILIYQFFWHTLCC